MSIQSSIHNSRDLEEVSITIIKHKNIASPFEGDLDHILDDIPSNFYWKKSHNSLKKNSNNFIKKNKENIHI